MQKVCDTEPTKFCKLEFCGPENPIQKDFLGNKIKLPHLFSVTKPKKALLSCAEKILCQGT